MVPKAISNRSGVHWVQVNHQVSLEMYVPHVIVMHVMKFHSHRSSKEEIIAAIEDNNGELGLCKLRTWTKHSS